jgi:ribosomal protein S18 acetylase RimI-like enzyme
MSWRVTSGGYAPQTVERLLRALPQWFGIEASNAAYVEAARRLPACLAWPATAPTGTDGDAGAAGVLLLERHFPGAAEVHLLAVDPAYHRQGAGRALLAAAQASLVSNGVEFLQVKTLGPSHPTRDTSAPESSTRRSGSPRWRRSTACGTRKTPA